VFGLFFSASCQRLQPKSQHPHGLSDAEFDSMFTESTPVTFAYHGYPWLTYRRANHDNFHVRGFNEEGTTTTPFDMTVLNGLDRFHLAMDAVERVPRRLNVAAHLQQPYNGGKPQFQRNAPAHAGNMQCRIVGQRSMVAGLSHLDHALNVSSPCLLWPPLAGTSNASHVDSPARRAGGRTRYRGSGGRGSCCFRH